MEPKVKQAIKAAKAKAPSPSLEKKEKQSSVKRRTAPKVADASEAKIALIIRMRGVGGIRDKKLRTMRQMHITRRYHACIMSRKPAVELAQLVRDYIAWGEPDEKTLAKLLDARLKLKGANSKPDSKFYSSLSVANSTELAAALLAGKVTVKSLELNGARPFFALHPPLKGIAGIKGHYPRGSLGYWGSHINELIVKML